MNATLLRNPRAGDRRETRVVSWLRDTAANDRVSRQQRGRLPHRSPATGRSIPPRATRVSKSRLASRRLTSRESRLGAIRVQLILHDAVTHDAVCQGAGPAIEAGYKGAPGRPAHDRVAPRHEHAADAALRQHEMVDPAPPSRQPPGERSALAGQFAQYAADTVLGASARLTAARTKERFFVTGNRRWPHCGPMKHPTAPILQQPDPRKLRKCSEFLDSGEWAIQDSNLGPLPEWKIAVARDRRWGSRPDLRVRLEDYAMPSGRLR